MPELPEVETVRRGLAPALVGRRIRRAEARRGDLRWPLPPDFARRLEGRSVTALERRGKYLLASLSGDLTLLSHLGMSGRFLVFDGDGSTVPGRFARAVGGDGVDGPHDHVVLETCDEGGGRAARIVFRDPRRFGVMDLVATSRRGEHRLLRDLGPEPLGESFSVEWLVARARGRRAPVKNLLLDQRTVAGVGNIYASEALHRAGISPRRAAGRIASKRLSGLVAAVREVLAEAIEAGGSSLRDFRGATGDLGYFQHGFAVYDREGEPCPRADCAGVVRRRVMAGRSTFWCPACQR